MLYHWYQLYKEPANNVYSMIYYDTKQKYITYTYIYIYNSINNNYILNFSCVFNVRTSQEEKPITKHNTN